MRKNVNVGSSLCDKLVIGCAVPGCLRSLEEVFISDDWRSSVALTASYVRVLRSYLPTSNFVKTYSTKNLCALKMDTRQKPLISNYTCLFKNDG